MANLRSCVGEKIELKNKALVLEAFDALFNKRDYATAECFRSPDDIQHSAHIEPGRDGVSSVLSRGQPTDVEVQNRET